MAGRPAGAEGSADDGQAPRYAEASIVARGAVPSRTLVSSHQVGWTSLLLDLHRDGPSEEPFETGPTPDQAITVMIDGAQEVECFSGGAWRRSIYRAGTAGLTPPGQVDRLRRRSRGPARGGRKVTLYIPHGVFRDVAEGMRRAGCVAVPDPGLDALAFDDPLLAATAVDLVRAIRSGAPDLYAQSAAQWLAVHLLGRTGRRVGVAGDAARRAPGALSDLRLRDVIEYMTAHLGDPLSLTELAGVAGVSPFHFARVFRQRTGTPPHAYLVRLRLEAARRLLAESDDGVATIAARCGFRSASHFGARFAREFGLTPTAFRRSRV